MDVIIDTDVALDDWMAISYLVMAPEVNVLGITTTGVGTAYLTPGTRIALNLLATLGHPSFPVAAGTSAALLYSNVYPISFRETVNDAYSVPLAINEAQPQSSALEFLVSTVTANRRAHSVDWRGHECGYPAPPAAGDRRRYRLDCGDGWGY